jgi:cell fate regulator YaaT (PSP1 superfamily)
MSGFQWMFSVCSWLFEFIGGTLIRIVKIQFHTAEKLYDFNAGSLELNSGDRVVVETDRGRCMAIVATAPTEISEEHAPESLKTILRKANHSDLEAAKSNLTREKETHLFCQAKITERNLDMKLVKVEYIFDGSKAVFYFTADGRIDFRDLVKDLAQKFHTRIEMKQIGVRDEAKIVGGLGICGRELCCSSFLRDFAPVSVKMAKEQNLALNPTKISGQCGRLLCCLGYEYETYCGLKQGMPKCGKRIQCGAVEGEVIKVDIFKSCFTLKTDDDRQVQLCRDDLPAGSIVERPRKTATQDKGKPEQKQEAAPSKPRRDKRREKGKSKENDPGKEKP